MLLCVYLAFEPTWQQSSTLHPHSDSLSQNKINRTRKPLEATRLYDFASATALSSVIAAPAAQAAANVASPSCVRALATR